MKIRMLMTVAGAFHNIEGGVKLGDVVDVEAAEARRYCALGYAEMVGGDEEHAFVVIRGEQATMPRHLEGQKGEPRNPDLKHTEPKNADPVAPVTTVPTTSFEVVEKPAEEKAEAEEPAEEKKAEVAPKPKPVYGETHPPGESGRGRGRPRKAR
jgi:hypothetical protein